MPTCTKICCKFNFVFHVSLVACMDTWTYRTRNKTIPSERANLHDRISRGVQNYQYVSTCTRIYRKFNFVFHVYPFACMDTWTYRTRNKIIPSGRANLHVRISRGVQNISICVLVLEVTVNSILFSTCPLLSVWTRGRIVQEIKL